MKSFFKLIFFFLIVLTVLSGTTAVVLMQPHVQRKVVTKILAMQVGKVNVESVDIELSRMAISGVRIEDQGRVIGLKNMRMSWQLGSLMSGSFLQVKDLMVTGLSVDLRGNNESTASSHKSSSKFKAGEAAPVLPKLRILEKVAIGGLSLDGFIRVSDTQTVQLDLEGANIGAQHWGAIQVKAKVVDASKKARYESIALVGTLTPVINSASNKHPLEGMDLSLGLNAKPSDGAKPLSLQMNGRLQAETAGEEYGFLVSQLEQDGTSLPLVKVKGVLNVPENKLQGEYRLALSRYHVYPFLENAELPPFMFNSQGSFSYDYTEGSTGIMGLAQMDAGPFNEGRQWGRADAFTFAAKYDFRLAYDHVECRVLDALLKDNQGRTLLNVDLLQPFHLQFTEDQVKLTQAKGELFKFDMQQLPLEYIAPWVEGVFMSGQPIDAEVVLSFDEAEDEILFKTRKPIQIVDLSLDYNERPVFRNLGLTVTASLSHKPEIADLFVSCMASGSSAPDWMSFQTHASMELKDPTLPHYVLEGSFKSALAHMAKQPIFAPPGNASLAADLHIEESFSVDLQGNLLQILGLSSKLVDSTREKPYYQLETLQPIAVDLSKGVLGLFTGHDYGEWCKLEFNDLPASLVSMFVPGYDLEGDTLNGSCTLSREKVGVPQDDILKLKTTEPFRFKGITVSTMGRALVRNVHLNFEPDMTMTTQKCHLGWGDLSLLIGEARVPAINVSGGLALDLKDINIGVGHLPTLNLVLSADLKQLMALPGVPDDTNVQGGVVNVSAKSSDERGGFNVQGQIQNLELKEPRSAVIYLLSFTGSGSVYDRNTLQCETTLDLQGPAGTSVLSASAWVTPNDLLRRYAVDLKGERLFADDFVLLAQAFKPVNELSDKRVVGNEKMRELDRTVDQVPFWQGAEGGVNLEINAIIFGNAVFDNVFCRVNIDSNKITLDPFGAEFSKAPIIVTSSIEFEKHAKKPYRLNADAQITNLAMGELLESRDPKKMPILEGTFAFDGRVEGEGPNLPVLINEVQGRCEVKGFNGVIRTTEALDNKLVKGGTQLLGLAGSLLGDEVKELSLAGQAVDVFGTIAFNELTVDLYRKENLDITLDKFEMKGSQIYMSGDGKVSYQPNVSILDQSLLANVRLDAKGSASTFLGALHLLRDETNIDGYYYGPAFKVKGSLSKPDFFEFYKLFIDRKGKSSKSSVQNNARDTEPEGSSNSPKTIEKAVEGVFKLFGG